MCLVHVLFIIPFTLYLSEQLFLSLSICLYLLSTHQSIYQFFSQTLTLTLYHSQSLSLPLSLPIFLPISLPPFLFGFGKKLSCFTFSSFLSLFGILFFSLLRCFFLLFLFTNISAVSDTLSPRQARLLPA